MNIRLFTLCDGAYNYNGKLTIVGTTDNIKVHNFPASVSVGIAIKVSFSPEEYGQKTMRLQIKNNAGGDVLPELKLPSTEAKSKNGEEARLVLAGNLQGVVFPEEGNYCIHLCVNDEESLLPFKVVK